MKRLGSESLAFGAAAGIPAAAGTLVQPGQTVTKNTGTLSPGATIGAGGTLAVMARATLSSFGAIVGPTTGTIAGVVNLGSAATLFAASTITASVNIVFQATSGTLELMGQRLALMSGTIVGWRAGDVIDIASAVVTSATLSDTATSLVVMQGAVALGTLTLSGVAAGQIVLPVPDGLGGTRLLLGMPGPAAGSLAATSGLPAHAFAWAGGSGGWNDPSNWLVGGFAASRVPGSADSVTIAGPPNSFAAIAGDAAAASLLTTGLVALASGNFAIGSVVTGSGQLAIGAGVTLSADTVTLQNAAGVVVTGSGARAVAAGTWTVASGIASVLNGGRVAAGALVLNGGTVAVDANSAVTLGGAVAQAGALVLSGSLSGWGSIRADIVNTGTIQACGGVLSLFGDLSGAGTATMAGGATLFLTGAADAAGGVLFQHDTAAATLELFAPERCAALLDGMAAGDVIDLAGIVLATVQWTPPGPEDGGIGTLDLGDQGVLSVRPAGTLDPARVSFAVAADGLGGTALTMVPCFTPGTLLQTDTGRVAIEHLGAGDRLLTRSGARKRIAWIGQRRYRRATVCTERQLRPVRVAAHALGPNRPRRALLVSPQHGIWIDGATGPYLVPAVALIDDMRITRAAADTALTYIHLALPEHDAVLAEGLAVETFLPGGHEHVHLLSTQSGRLPRGMAAGWQRLENGEALHRLRRRLGLTRELPALHRAVRGALDSARLQDGALVVEGWAARAESGGEWEPPLTVELCHEGVVCATVVANAWRPDLDRVGLAGGHCAFVARIPWRAERLFGRLGARVIGG